MSDEISASFNLPARFVIRIDTVSGERAELKVAVGYDQELILSETYTPFEIEFSANGYTALMCSKKSGDDISAEVWSDVYGEFKKIGDGSGGSTQKFMFSPIGPVNSLTSSAL